MLFAYLWYWTTIANALSSLLLTRPSFATVAGAAAAHAVTHAQ
jgi:hypothetical protein